MDPGQRAAATAAQVASAALTKDQAIALLKVEGLDLSNFLPPSRTSGTTVTNNFNITGVSPSEVMDAMGEAVNLTGPMPPHWQQSAN